MEEKFFAVMGRINDLSGHLHYVMLARHAKWRHMDVQLYGFFVLQVTAKENIRSFRGKISDEAVKHVLPFNKGIYMPPDTDAGFVAILDMFGRIWRGRWSIASLGVYRG